MSHPQGPQDTLTTGNGGNQIKEGQCLAPRNQPQPTDGGNWVLFDKTSELIFWAGTTALVVALVSLCASLTIFFFV